MKIELRPLVVADADAVYEMFQSMPAAENGVYNKAFGLSKQEFAHWCTREVGFAAGIGLPDGYVAAMTYVLWIDGVPVGRSNLRHSLTPALEVDGGHIGMQMSCCGKR